MDPAEPESVVVPPVITGVAEGGSEGGEAGGASLSLVSAIGRSEGATETSSVIERHRLFVLCDGEGKRVSGKLASALLVDALVAAFGADGADVEHADASLPPVAERLRRSLLAARAAVDTSAIETLAAHFGSDNKSLYLASVGEDRAYRLRAGELSRLTKGSSSGSSGSGAEAAVEVVVTDVAKDDLYVFGSDQAFIALGDELSGVLKHDPSVARVAERFVEAATRTVKSGSMTAIIVRVESA